MDLPVWILVVGILIPLTCAGPADQGPQIFNEDNKEETKAVEPAPASPKVHKREPKYEMKEVILYLTPTQIKALEAGQGLIQPQALVGPPPKPEAQPQTTPQPEILTTRQHIPSTINSQGKLEKEIKAMKQQRMQLQELNKNKANSIDLLKISPENNAHPSPQLDLQKREKYIDSPIQIDLKQPIEATKREQKRRPHEEDPDIPDFEQLIKVIENYRQPEVKQPAQQQAQQPIQHSVQQLQYANAENQFKPFTPQNLPQNYAYLNFYPQRKPADTGNYQLYYLDSQQQQTKEQQRQQEHNIKAHQEQRQNTYYLQLEQKPQTPIFQSPTTYYLPSNEQKLQQQPAPQERPNLFYYHEERPKELTLQPGQYQKQVFLQHLPTQGNLQPEHSRKPAFLNFDQSPNSEHIPQQYVYQAENVKLSQPQVHQIPNLFNLDPKFQLIPYEYDLQNKLEAQQILQAQLNEHEISLQHLQTQRAEAHQLENINTQQFLFQKELEPQYLQTEPLKQDNGYQLSETLKLDYQQDAKAPELKIEPEIQPLKEEDIKHFHPAHQEKLKQVMEAQKQLEKLEKEEKEASRLDAELEEEQRKAEKFKEEQHKEQQAKFEQIDYPFTLEYLMKLEPKRTQMHSILKPLFQGHNIAETLQQQKDNFPHHQIHMQNGFKPLQYAPKYNDEKYAREVEKILNKNRIEKQKALEKAVAIANEPPEIHIKIEDEYKKQSPVETIKHVNIPIPTPVMVPVPAPFEVKVPQPYPVPLEIYRPVPVPIVKTGRVEVEKPFPVEIEKRVPVPVTKNVYVKIEKPYIVEKVVPVEIKKEIPVHIPVRKPQKLTIIKHVWGS